MLVKGDIKCLHCGFISGEWVGVNGAPLTFAGFSTSAPRPEVEDAAPLRCLRCEGPVFLDDAGLVVSTARIRRIRRLRAQLAAMEVRNPRRAA